MKKVSFLLLILSTILCFISCRQENFPKEYSVLNQTGFEIDELYVCEYNEVGDRVYNHIVKKLSNGRTYNITTYNEDVVKVKIYIGDFDNWIQRVFYLNEDGITRINIYNSTLVGPNEP